MKINKKKFIDKIEKLLVDSPKLESKVLNFALQKLDSGEYVLENNLVYTADHKRLIYVLGNDSTITIPEGVEIIGERAVSGKKNLKKLSFPNTLRKIHKDAFSDCDALVEVIIPSSVKHIEAYAFSDCDSLKSVYFESIPKELSHKTFADCTKLRSISVPAEGVKTIRKALHVLDGDIEHMVVGRNIEQEKEEDKKVLSKKTGIQNRKSNK